jgi:hypothetical protein
LLFWRMLASVRETGPAPQMAILSCVDAVMTYGWCFGQSLETFAERLSGR